MTYFLRKAEYYLFRVKFILYFANWTLVPSTYSGHV